MVLSRSRGVNAEGYYIFHMTLHQILSCGIDTRDWERDRQN